MGLSNCLLKHSRCSISTSGAWEHVLAVLGVLRAGMRFHGGVPASTAERCQRHGSCCPGAHGSTGAGSRARRRSGQGGENPTCAPCSGLLLALPHPWRSKAARLCQSIPQPGITLLSALAHSGTAAISGSSPLLRAPWPAGCRA